MHPATGAPVAATRRKLLPVSMCCDVVVSGVAFVGAEDLEIRI